MDTDSGDKKKVKRRARERKSENAYYKRGNDDSSIGGYKSVDKDKEVSEPMASTKKDKSFRVYTAVDGLMEHFLNHRAKQVKLPKPPGVLETEEPKTKKKLPTCNLIITRCDNLISPGRPFGAIHNGGTNVRRKDDIAERKLTRSRRHDSESGLANNGVIEKIGRRCSLIQISDCGSSTEVGMKPHKCQICPKSFVRLGNLKRHIRTHACERRPKCHLCSKSFVRLGNLKQHILTHTSERPHKCQVCSKSFGQLSNLKTHIRTHTDERPHKCQVCSKPFRQLEHLKNHNRTHTGERPHKCQVCSKPFKQLGHLKTHMRSHTVEVVSDHIKGRKQKGTHLLDEKV